MTEPTKTPEPPEPEPAPKQPRVWSDRRWIDYELGWPIDAALILQEKPCD